jgi:hypothetical protein
MCVFAGNGQPRPAAIEGNVSMNSNMIVALIPLIAIQLALQIYALYDIFKHGGARPPLPTWGWVAIVVFGEIVGVVLYFAIGRKEDEL